MALILTTRIQDVHDPVQAPTLKACITGARQQLADRSVWLIGILATVVILVPFATRDTLTPVYAEQLGARAGILALLGNIHLLFYGLAIALCSSVFYQRLGLVKNRRARHRFTGDLHFRHSLYQQYLCYLPVAGAGGVLVRYGLCRIHVAQRSEYLV